MVLAFRTSNYAQNIYQFGTERLTARDGFTGVAAGYYTPVEQYAADHYTTVEIANALTQGWITEQEKTETIALKGAGDPV